MHHSSIIAHLFKIRYQLQILRRLSFNFILILNKNGFFLCNFLRNYSLLLFAYIFMFDANILDILAQF